MRFTAARKRDIILKIQRGELTFHTAMQKYNLSAEELQSWITRYAAFGLKGLKATKVQAITAIASLANTTLGEKSCT